MVKEIPVFSRHNEPYLAAIPFLLNKWVYVLVTYYSLKSVMRDLLIMIMVPYERRDNKLSNDVYVIEKIILGYLVIYRQSWVPLNKRVYVLVTYYFP